MTCDILMLKMFKGIWKVKNKGLTKHQPRDIIRIEKERKPKQWQD